MTSFATGVSAQEDAERFIMETGGLPEITRAALDLTSAFDQTLVEIEGAELASRFLDTLSDHASEMLKTTQP